MTCLFREWPRSPVVHDTSTTLSGGRTASQRKFLHLQNNFRKLAREAAYPVAAESFAQRALFVISPPFFGPSTAELLLQRRQLGPQRIHFLSKIVLVLCRGRDGRRRLRNGGRAGWRQA